MSFKANYFFSELVHAAQQSKNWSMVEAQKLLERQKSKGDLVSQTVLFETGYGPSGLPHIGTFGEVARTLMVRHAFHVLTENKVKTRLLCFSDDMDALRKVPENVPCRDILLEYIGKPLTCVPDPLALAALPQDARRDAVGQVESFGACNNKRLREFLDRFGFEYEFASSTQYYRAGRFDETLKLMLRHYEDIMAIMLPSLGEERQATYSIFLPISKHSGRVLQVPIEIKDREAGIIRYFDDAIDGWDETSIFGGNVKCQWKADWALRWAALSVDYEMAGKDLIDSVTLAGKICRAIKARPPAGFNYELFLDDKGQKISKSKGNGLTIEEWLRYAPESSLRLYMYQKPKTAKRLFFDVIPKAVDEYYSYLKSYKQLREGLGEGQTKEAYAGALLDNPLFHIYAGDVPDEDVPPISFSMLLNLVSAAGANDASVIWGFLERYCGSSDVRNSKSMADCISYAINYYHDYILPNRQYRVANEREKAVLRDIASSLKQCLYEAKESAASPAASQLQDLLLDVARRHGGEYIDSEKLNAAGLPSVKGSFFQFLYQVLLGAQSGPRFGSFIELYGIDATIALLERALADKLA